MTTKIWHDANLPLTNGHTNGDGNTTDGVPTTNSVPITRIHPPWIPPKDSPLQDPHLPRANLAATHAHPHGTTTDAWSKKYAHQTVLQQHCAFFDRDADGILWPSDTYTGFHRLGFGIFLSTLAAVIIHVNFAWPTNPTWIPDPLFRIHLTNIHRALHGSDTGTYDAQGRFRPQAFEDIFAKYADGRDYLTLGSLGRMVLAQRNVSDVIGLGGEVFEWGATYLMVWPADGKLWREDVRRVFDGSIFHGWAGEVERKRRAARKG